MLAKSCYSGIMSHHREMQLSHTECNTKEKRCMVQFRWVTLYHSSLAAIWNYLAWWFAFVFWSFPPGQNPHSTKTSSALFTVNLDSEDTAVVVVDSINIWEIIFPSSYSRIHGKTGLRWPALGMLRWQRVMSVPRLASGISYTEFPSQPTHGWKWRYVMSMTVTAGLQ